MAVALVLLMPESWAKLSRFQFTDVLDEGGRAIDSAWCFFQDEIGYMYIGTQSGLYVYNGYEYFIYKHDPSVADSLSGNWVNCIFGDGDGRVWIGTRSGLNEFQRKTGTFARYQHDPADPESLRMDYINTIDEGEGGRLWIGTRQGASSFDPVSERFQSIDHQPGEMDAWRNQLECLYVDRFGVVWLGTEENGLFAYDLESERFEHFLHDADVPGSISGNTITSVVEDAAGRLWVATENLEANSALIAENDKSLGRGGLNRFDRELRRFVRVPVVSEYASQEREEEISTLYSDSLGKIWVGTLSGDLYRFDPESLEFDYVPDSNPAIARVTSVYLDRTGLLWVGRQFGSVLKASVRSESFKSWSAGPEGSLSDQHVVALHEDRNGAIWVGTLGGGLNRYDTSTERFTSYGEGILPANRISSIYEDSLGNFWIGIFGVSLCLFDRETEKVVREFHFDPDDERSISDVRIRAILEDSRGRLWFGTRSGLNVFDRESQSFTRFVHDPENGGSLVGNAVKCLMEDREGNLWVGTDSGVSVMDPRGTFFRRFEHDPDNSNSLSSNLVRCMYQDFNDSIWIGTRIGLNRLDANALQFERLYESDGLASDIVYGVLEDSLGYIWISSSRGISRFDPSSGGFSNIDNDGDFINSGFELNAYLNARNGRMYFGGTNGLDSFDPIEIGSRRTVPALAFSSVKTFDEPIVDWFGVAGLSSLEVPSSDNFIAFEFAVLEFINPLKNRYRYRLDGFDKEWVSGGLRRYASYTNLPPRKYVFQVQGANSSGVWNEQGIELGLIVTPMYWQTLWFRGILVLLVIGTGVAGYIRRMQRIVDQRKKLEQEVAVRTKDLKLAKSKIEIQNEELTDHRTNLERLVHERTSQLENQKLKAEESDRLKSAFLENMSHEIRTPMNAIMGFLQIIRMDDSSNEENEEYFDIIQNAGDTLLSLIDDILDLSSIDAGNLKLEIEECDLLDLLGKVFVTHKMLIKSSRGAAVETFLEYGNDSARDSKKESLVIMTDALRLEQILNNLMSNAAKFTERGSITLGYEIDEYRLCIYVKDTGIGIAPGDCEKIFERFGKLSVENAEKLYRGVGLGLTISKKLIGMLGGEIRLESELGSGSRFELRFDASVIVGKTAKPEKFERTKEHQRPDPMIGRTVLIAEDEDANYEYIEQVFKHDKLELLRARDGREVLELVEEGRHIDIVLMDIKMPVYDGHEVTRILKKKYPNIPIIAQTAFAAKEDKDACMRSGANGFLSKPYGPDELRRAVFEWL